MNELDYGFSFMEKFVQLSFEVPKPSAQILAESFNEESFNIESIIEKELSDFYPIIDKDLSPDIEYKLLEMAADFFDYNPRHLKQYINSVRLQTYILYYAVGVSKIKKGSINIEQLGKFIAIILKYPRLRKKLKDDSTLLATLETSFLNENKGQESYVLEGLDIQKLLQVSPKVSKLRSLLLAERWDEADMETLNIMLRVAKRTDERWFRKEDLENFPCEVLYAISQIWDECSKDEEGNSRYGFLIQKEKYLALDGEQRCDIETWIKFAEAVGRRGNSGGSTKLGHYPFYMYGDMGDWEGTVGTLAFKLMLALKPIFGISFEPVVGYLLHRLNDCEQKLITSDSIRNEDTN